MFQEDVHRARDTVQLLQQETLDLISPANSPDRLPNLGTGEEHVYKTSVSDKSDFKQHLIDT